MKILLACWGHRWKPDYSVLDLIATHYSQHPDVSLTALKKACWDSWRHYCPHLSLTPSGEDDRHMHKFSPTHQCPKLGLCRAANEPKQLTCQEVQPVSFPKQNRSITENIICPFTIPNLVAPQEGLLHSTCTSINNTGEMIQGLETLTWDRYLKMFLPKVYEICSRTCFHK